MIFISLHFHPFIADNFIYSFDNGKLRKRIFVRSKNMSVYFVIFERRKRGKLKKNKEWLKKKEWRLYKNIGLPTFIFWFFRKQNKHLNLL